MSDLRRMSIPQVLADEAESLIRAREEAGRLHATGDIRAAGNQVETQARLIFQRRLPSRYRIAHGHVIDYRGYVSPQTDIIIADAFNTPTMFEASDGTEYVPFESVYAIGEVKSTYYKSERPLPKAIDTIQAICEGLKRSPTARNPLFYFVLFVDSGDLVLEDVATLYRNTPIENLPNLVCWLDRGTLLYMRFVKSGLGESIPLNYCLSPSLDRDPSEDNRWVLVPWGLEERRKGSNLAAVIGILAEHMEGCRLVPPNLRTYIALLTWDTAVILT